MDDRERLVSMLGVALGIALVILGVAAYVLSEFASVTALIPSALGLAIALLGAAIPRTDRPRRAAYGIGALAALGALGSLRGVPDIVALLTGGTPESTVAAVAQGLTILVCLVLLAAVGGYVLEQRSASTSASR